MITETKKYPNTKLSGEYMSDINEKQEINQNENSLLGKNKSDLNLEVKNETSLKTETNTENLKEEQKPKRKIFKNNKNKANKPKHHNTHSNHSHQKKHYTHNPNRYLPKDDNEVIEEINQSSYDPFNKENTLFSYIHQKTGFNPTTFWNLLNELLVEKNIEDIKNYGGMNLIPSIILYGKEEIYENIMESYSSKLSKEDFENFLFPLSMNKNPLFIEKTIFYYDKLYQSDDDFIKKLILQASKMSYRKEPNILLLNWLNNNIKNNEEYFWQNCISERNVILFEQALKFENLHKYLQINYSQFEPLIEEIGKTHTTKNSFGKKYTPVEFENKNDKITHTTSTLNKEVESFKEEAQGKPEIIRKRKKACV